MVVLAAREALVAEATKRAAEVLEADRGLGPAALRAFAEAIRAEALPCTARVASTAETALAAAAAIVALKAAHAMFAAISALLAAGLAAAPEAVVILVPGP